MVRIGCVGAFHERKHLFGRRHSVVESVGASKGGAAGAGGVERELVPRTQFTECEVGRRLDIGGGLIIVGVQVGGIGCLDQQPHAVGGWPVALAIHLRAQFVELGSQLDEPAAESMQRQSLQTCLSEIGRGDSRIVSAGTGVGPMGSDAPLTRKNFRGGCAADGCSGHRRPHCRTRSGARALDHRCCAAHSRGRTVGAHRPCPVAAVY